MEAQATLDVVKTSSPSQTQKLAQELAGKLNAGDVIALFGDLGAGKTIFVQGLAKGLGIKKRILSPTFVLLRSYPIKNRSLFFHHLDLYRIESSKDLKMLDLPQIFSKNSIVAVEWAEKMKKQLPQKRIDVFLKSEGENVRSIKIIPVAYSSSDRAKQGNREVTLKTSISSSGKFSTSSNINKAAQILKNGGVIILPTDTVYGIGCRFDDPKAIERIYQIKGTPQNQPFPILVSSIKQVEALTEIPDSARELMQKYWPGGLTIILPGLSTYSNPGLEQLYKPGLEGAKIGFRMPNSKLALSLIEKVGVPIIGTSANLHGAKPPTSYQELDPQLVRLADFVLKGECKLGIESTVVDATVDPLNVLRQGTVKL